MNCCNCCKRYYTGALSPVPATDDMTQEVGARGAKLFTRPTGGGGSTKLFPRRCITGKSGKNYALNYLTEKETGYATFTEFIQAVCNGDIIPLNGYVQESGAVTAFIPDIFSHGDVGQLGNKFIMPLVVSTTDFTVSTPLLEIGDTVTWTDQLGY